MSNEPKQRSDEAGLLTAEELLQHIPISSRQLKELRAQRKIPFIVVNRKLILYNLAAVLKSLQRLEIKALS